MSEQQNISTDSNRQKSVLLKLIIPIIALALIVGGYFGLNFIASKIDADELRTEKFTTELKQLQTKYNQLQISLQDLQNVIQKSDITKAKNWRPIVIEHLIRMADLTLNTTRDTKLALSFLLMAKQYANTSELSMISHALNKDIASLQTVPEIEISSLVLKIEALSQKINSLPIIVQQFTGTQKKPAEESSSDINLWQRFFVSTTKALKDVVVIRRQVIEPLLSPEQETILRLNIQTKLLQAELAVMHLQNKLYHACLEETTNLIARYLVTNQIVNTDILPALKELQGIDLQPKLPLLAESLAAVQNFMSTNKIQEELSSEPQIPPPAKGAKPI